MGRGFGITARVDHDVVRTLAGEAERLGYSSLWVNDMPGADGLESLAAAAGASERLSLGVGVLPLDQHPPEAIVARLRRFELPVDRLVLGVGSGAAGGGLARVRAAVPVLEREAGATIVVGALGPAMAALAGEAAGGAVLNWLTARWAEQAGGWVLDAAERAGRTRPMLAAYVRCGLLPDATARLQAELANYDGLGHFERHLQRMGATAEDTCVLRSDAAALQEGIATYERVLDETIVRAVTPDDRAESLLGLLRACAPAGGA